MKMSLGKFLLAGTMAAFCLPAMLMGQALTPAMKAKAESKISAIKAWGSDPQIVAAVKAYNASPPAGAKEMTNEKWTSLTVLDPFVRSFGKDPLAEYLKSKRDESIAEVFVSGADGGKVAFISKTTSWSHKGKPKHEVPMSGKTFIGPIETDESSGQQQFQVGVPVLEGGKPIGSIVVGLKAASFQ
jgi:hypothetical protein